MVLPAVRVTFAAVFPVSTTAALTCLAVQCSGPSASALGVIQDNDSARVNMAHILFIRPSLYICVFKCFDTLASDVIRLSPVCPTKRVNVVFVDARPQPRPATDYSDCQPRRLMIFFTAAGSIVAKKLGDSHERSRAISRSNSRIFGPRRS